MRDTNLSLSEGPRLHGLLVLVAGSGELLGQDEMDQEIEALKSAVVAVQDQLDDQGRQTSKDNIVIEGTAVAKLSDEELPVDVAIRVIRMGWGLTMVRDGFKTVKFETRRSGKNRILAKFNQVWEGSIFHKIITTRPDELSQGTLFRHLHLRTSNDKTMDFVARNMKKAGELKDFIWHYVSGRLKVTFPNGKRKTFSSARALRKCCSQQLLSELKAKDKKRREQQERDASPMHH